MSGYTGYEIVGEVDGDGVGECEGVLKGEGGSDGLIGDTHDSIRPSDVQGDSADLPSELRIIVGANQVVHGFNLEHSNAILRGVVYCRSANSSPSSC